mmetsp:Transcript_5894/g.11891  ORF Transcript_5894/g.11891 Transcript_5894/m.11891 type:complete len:122 (-) Transcript_5894:251-616(-)
MASRCGAGSRRGSGCLAVCLLVWIGSSGLGGPAFVSQPPRPTQVGAIAPAAALFATLAPSGAAPAWASDYKMVSGQSAAGGLGDAGSGNVTLLIGCIAVLAALVFGVSSLFKSFEDKPLPK